MPDYRRVKIKGATYFFTLVTYKRQKLFLTEDKRDLFLDSLQYVQNYHPFTLTAYCILQDHIHLIWEMPTDDANYSMRIGEIKRRFSKKFAAHFGSPKKLRPNQVKRREAGIWQPRFWEHYIRDEDDLSRHIDYVHYNPVKHGLVQQVSDWPSSSFMGYVRQGFYQQDWGQGCELDSMGQFGE